MKKQITQWLCCCLWLIVATTTHAQMEVKDVATPPYDAESLIYNELLGEGVQITDVVYEGTNNSVGFFSNGGASVGIGSGILLTTGSVSSVGANVGVEQVGSVEASVDNGSIVQDADMTTLADFSLFNISKYTITFIPSSDSISFRYVFASEEYPEFVCSDYNDIFGFFISGPGINGPYENNAENIAIIPGTNLPVKINNVNGGGVGDQGVLSNCENGNGYLNFSEFYVDNNGTNQQPVFDGFLKVFTATAKVIPCSTYTIKIVVADQGDPQRDSGVFLEAKSFSSEFVSTSIVTESIDGTIIEGCTDATIDISIPSPRSTDINLDINVFGAAQEGIDFPSFPPAIIPAGQTSVTIPIVATEDGIAEGLESIYFDVQLNQCFRDTFSLLINDNQIPQIDLGKDTSVCPNTTLALTVPDFNSTLPAPAIFEVANANQPITSPRPGALPTEVKIPLEVVGVTPLDLGPGLIQSVCIDIDHNRLVDLEIYLASPSGQLIPLSTGNGGTDADYSNTCFTPDAVNSIKDATAPFTGNFQPEGLWENLWANDSPLNGTWQLVIIDEAFGFNGILNSWSITFNPVISYTYTWENTDGLSCTDCPNPTITTTASNDYILSIEDNYGCISTDTLAVTVYETLMEEPTITCTEQTFDALTYEWTTVAGAISYEVNINSTDWIAIPDGQTTYQVDNLALNETVNFEVRAVGGCNNMESSTTCTTLDCTEITLDSEDIQPVSCNGGGDGSVQLTVAGDNPPFNYTLDGGSNTTGVFDNLTAGTYTITVTDEKDCTNSFEVTISEPTALGVIPITIADIGCNGEEGSATFDVTGGTPPYAFNWNTAATDSILTSTMGGDFVVTITDANSCEITGMVAIADKTPLEISLDSTATCEGANTGTATANVSGGLAPYSYEWDNGQTTATISDLTPATYTLTVTDANDCTITGATKVEAIAVLPAPEVSCGTTTSDAVTFVWSSIPDASGFEVNVNNGDWESASASLSHTVSGLSLGETVDIEVRGVGDCDAPSSTMSCTTIDCSTIDVTSDSSPVTCNGQSDGSITLAATGDHPPFQYELNGDSNTDGLYTGLAAGDYSILVTDTLGCTTSLEINISEPTALGVVPVTIANIGCNGEEGSATFEVTGGMPPYAFNWDTGVTDSIFTSSTGGDFAVTVTDANGCEMNGTVTIAETPPLETTLSPSSICDGSTTGSASVNVSGGIAPYNYEWNTGQTTDLIENLAPATYYVTITDANDCTITDSTIIEAIPVLPAPEVSCGTITSDAITFIWASIPDASGFEVNVNNIGWENASDPLAHTISGLSLGETVTIEVRGMGDCNPPITTFSCTTVDCSVIDVASDVGPITCNGQSDGSLRITATGDNAPFQYELNGDSNTDGIFEDLPAGDYSVVVTDNIGCSTTTQLTINEPAALVAMAAVTQEMTCDQMGMATLTIEGGTAPYNTTWSDGTTDETSVQLAGGDHTVSIVDAVGCTTEAAVFITPYIDMVASITTVNNTCSTPPVGSVTVEVQGGNPDYTYLWDDENGQTTSIASALIAGNYTVTIMDASNCVLTMTGVVESPSGISIDSIVGTAVSCAGATDGEAIAYVSGGDGTINLSWSNNQTTETATNLSADSYTLSVVDESGCEATATVNITEPTAITLEAPMASVPCENDSTNLDLTVAGGNPDYTFLWSTGETTEDLANLTAGTYEVTVTDNNNCTATLSTAVLAASDFTVSLTTTPVQCANELEGSIQSTVTGGVAPYQYDWSTGATTEAINNLGIGEYSLVLTDANGCVISASETIQSPSDIQVTTEVMQPLCATDAGSFLATPNGGTPPYDLLVNGQSYGDQMRIDNLTAGTYRVMIADAENCIQPVDTFEIIDIAPIAIDLEAQSLVNIGDSISLNPEIINGTAPFDYFWETSISNSLSCPDCANLVVKPFSNTTFTLEVVDANGCAATTSTVIRVDKTRKIYAPNAFSPNSDGINDQFVLYGEETATIKKMSIFDRWGNLVYEKENMPLNDFPAGWNGTNNGQEMQSSVFTWFAEIEFIDRQVELFRGSVTLVK